MGDIGGYIVDRNRRYIVYRDIFINKNSYTAIYRIQFIK